MINTNTYEQFQSQKYIGIGQHLNIEKHLVSEDCSPHGHNYFEIELILSGTGIYSVNGTDYDVQTYNVFLSTPADFHQIQPESEIHLLNLSFNEEILNDSMIVSLSSKKVMRAYAFDSATLALLRSAFELLIEEHRIQGRCINLLCEYILEFLIRNNSTKHISSSAPETLSGIKKALLYLEMHFKEDITLATLANQAGFHPTYFSELFHQTTGETYKERLNALRIRHAKTLLKNGYSVSNACYESGFGSLSNFLTVFKQTYNMTPTQYKNSLHK